MSPVRLLRHTSAKLSRVDRRQFTASTQCLVNPLLNLSHFSAAKEAQFLSKHTKVPREEFHPHLQLIRSSEVDPFAPVAGASPSVVAALNKAKTGQTDMQTAYTLAISNMMSQLEVSRREASATAQTIARMQEKFRREERSAFWMLMASIGVLSFVLLETNAAGDLKERFKDQMKDWQWLGNPPSHVTARRSNVPGPARISSGNAPVVEQSHEMDRESEQLLIQRHVAKVNADVNRLWEQYVEKFEHAKANSSSVQGWRWSSLFWSSASR